MIDYDGGFLFLVYDSSAVWVARGSFKFYDLAPNEKSLFTSASK